MLLKVWKLFGFFMFALRARTRPRWPLFLEGASHVLDKIFCPFCFWRISAIPMCITRKQENHDQYIHGTRLRTVVPLNVMSTGIQIWREKGDIGRRVTDWPSSIYYKPGRAAFLYVVAPCLSTSQRNERGEERKPSAKLPTTFILVRRRPLRVYLSGQTDFTSFCNRRLRTSAC